MEPKNPNEKPKALRCPSLQKMVRHFGSYSAIPPEAWERYDKAMAEWKAALRAGEQVEYGEM